MDEYIGKGALYDKVWDFCEGKKSISKKDILSIIDEAPSVEGVFPPCKAGETIYRLVYVPNHISAKITPLKVIGFHLLYEDHPGKTTRDEHFICYNRETNKIVHIPFKEIGKTVFFGEAEAEKALNAVKNDEK